MKITTILSAKSPLGRPVDFAYRSNILVVVASGLVAAVVGTYNLVAQEPLPTPWWVAGGGVFVAWAIARELDPDHNMAATAAMVPAAVFSALARPSLLAGAGLLLAVRLTSGTVGLPRRGFDTALLVALGAMLGFSGEAIVVVPALMVAVVIHGNTRRSSVLAAGAVGGIALVSYLNGGLGQRLGPPGLAAIASVLLIGAAVAVTLPVGRIRSRTDTGQMRIIGWRVAVSRIMAGTTVTIAVVLGGQIGGFAPVATIVSSMMGVVAVRLLTRPAVPAASRVEAWLSQ
jgi:hypothetical protein